MLDLPKEKLANLLSENYHLSPIILEKSAWGYNTTAYYLQLENKKSYVAKVGMNKDDKPAKAEKDVAISEAIREFLPTAPYLKNSEGKFVTLFDGYILRVCVYVNGTTPFDMNMEIYSQVLRYLEIIHKLDPQKLYPELKILAGYEGPVKFLHGDLTASNVIVAENKIISVLDFEDALLGPAEYDLARSAVFCWFRMKNVPFSEVFQKTLKEYSSPVNSKEFHKYCKFHAENHLTEVIKNKSRYDDEVFWNDDYRFSKNAVREIEEITS